jgi:hypothetical protein
MIQNAPPHTRKKLVGQKSLKKAKSQIVVFVLGLGGSFFAVLGFELRTYTLSHFTSPFFVMNFFEIGSRELFERGGFQR